MYSICLVVAIAAGGAAPAHDRSAGVRQDLDDLKRGVEELRKQQQDQRVDELKLKIAELQQDKVEEKLHDIRRSVEEMKHGMLAPHVSPALAPFMEWHVPPMAMPYLLPTTTPGRAMILLEVPAGAALSVDGRDIPLTSTSATFVTPPLTEGKSYVYLFKVNVVRADKVVTRTKKVSVRAGAVVRVGYEEMAPPPIPD